MKKILLGFAAFSLILTGCQKSEVVDDINTGEGQFVFSPYQGKPSKGAELINSELNKNGETFPIYAYRGALAGDITPYFAEVLTYGSPNAGKWNTTIPRFLIDKDPIHFFAYFAKGTTNGEVENAEFAPKTGNLATGTYPTLTYTVKDNASVDLVASTVLDNKGTGVLIPFRHILSQINFGVKGYFGAKIAISDINIMQVKEKGTFSFTPNDQTRKWTPAVTPLKDYPYLFAGASNEFATPGGVLNGNVWEKGTESDNVYILGDGGKWSAGRTATTFYVTGANNTTVKGDVIVPEGAGATAKLENSLILLPQQLATGMSEAYVTFKYHITDLDGNDVYGTDAAPLNGKFDLNLNNTGNVKYGDEWQPNLRYVYLIDFKGLLDGSLLSFTVDVDAQPWKNHDDDLGLVLISSMGEPIFIQSISTLPVGGNLDIPVGHVFTDIAWDWSTYSMPANVFTTAGQTFTVDFKNVIFNGNGITVTPPAGFNIGVAGANVANTPIKVTSKTTVLTFTKIANN